MSELKTTGSRWSLKTFSAQKLKTFKYLVKSHFYYCHCRGHCHWIRTCLGRTQNLPLDPDTVFHCCVTSLYTSSAQIFKVLDFLIYGLICGIWFRMYLASTIRKEFLIFIFFSHCYFYYLLLWMEAMILLIWKDRTVILNFEYNPSSDIAPLKQVG